MNFIKFFHKKVKNKKKLHNNRKSITKINPEFEMLIPDKPNRLQMNKTCYIILI